MKKFKLFAVLFVMVCLLISGVIFAYDRPLMAVQLPAPVKAFVQNNFQGQTILYAERDLNSFECHLSNGTQVDLSKNGDWKKVDSGFMSAVPAALVPIPIRQYVNGSFPGAIITKIEKEVYGYDIELSDEIELKFTRNGTLLLMED